jgi:hypothetical protein
MSFFEGQLMLLPQPVKLSKKGTPWAVFFLQDKRMNKAKVLCFNDLAYRAVKELTVRGDNIVIEIWQEEEEDGDVRQIKASSFTTPNHKLSSRDKDIAKAGGEEAYRKEQEQEYRERYKSGLRRVKKGDVFTWQPIDFCVQVGKKWHDKTQFACDVLGGKKVTELLMDKTAFKAAGSHKKLLEEIVQLAVGDYVEEEGEEEVKKRGTV